MATKRATAMRSRDVFDPADYLTANCADGREVAEWLEAEGHVVHSRQEGRYDRQVRRWRDGEMPGIDALDRVFVHFDRVISELPDDVWLRRRRLTNRERQVA